MNEVWGLGLTVSSRKNAEDGAAQTVRRGCHRWRPGGLHRRAHVSARRLGGGTY
jgi:hypothetical protein